MLPLALPIWSVDLRRSQAIEYIISCVRILTSQQAGSYGSQLKFHRDYSRLLRAPFVQERFTTIGGYS